MSENILELGHYFPDRESALAFARATGRGYTLLDRTGIDDYGDVFVLVPDGGPEGEEWESMCNERPWKPETLARFFGPDRPGVLDGSGGVDHDENVENTTPEPPVAGVPDTPDGPPSSTSFAEMARIAAAFERMPDRFRLYDDEELGSFPPVEWFPGLEGVLPKRELVGLYGPGDSYKSFTVLDWALHIASLGLPVLYIAAEGASGLRARIEAWKQLRGIDSLPSLRVMPTPMKMHEETDVLAFVASVELQVAGWGTPVLVVVDTLARNFVGGNENSPQDMGLFVDGAELIRDKFKCAVNVVHHSTKDGSSERGTESLRNASFAMFRFERTGSRTATVTCDRMKDAERPKPVKLKPEVVELKPDEDGKPRSSLVACWPFEEELVSDGPLPDDWRVKQALMDAAIVEYLRDHGTGLDRCSQRQVCKGVSGRDSTVAERLKALSLDPMSPVQIEKDGKTVAYFYDLPPIH
jgi:hypothetical protein